MNRTPRDPDILGDLSIAPITSQGDDGFYLSRADGDGPVLVTIAPNGAGIGLAEAEAYACLLTRAPAMLRLLHEALAIFAAAFDADEAICGGDLVDRFSAWRIKTKAALDRPLGPPAT